MNFIIYQIFHDYPKVELQVSNQQYRLIIMSIRNKKLLNI